MGINKFFDDPIHTSKFQDDFHPTLKFYDDGFKGPSFKVTDDPIQTGPWGEGPYTWVENINTMAEGIDTSGWQFDPSIIYSAQPFVLANPHHSMEWTKTFGDPNDPATKLRYMESQLKMIEQSSAQMQDQLKQMNEYGEKLKAEMKEIESAQKKTK